MFSGFSIYRNKVKSGGQSGLSQQPSFDTLSPSQGQLLQLGLESFDSVFNNVLGKYSQDVAQSVLAYLATEDAESTDVHTAIVSSDALLIRDIVSRLDQLQFKSIPLDESNCGNMKSVLKSLGQQLISVNANISSIDDLLQHQVSCEQKLVIILSNVESMQTVVLERVIYIIHKLKQSFGLNLIIGCDLTLSFTTLVSHSVFSLIQVETFSLSSKGELVDEIMQELWSCTCDPQRGLDGLVNLSHDSLKFIVDTSRQSLLPVEKLHKLLQYTLMSQSCSGCNLTLFDTSEMDQKSIAQNLPLDRIRMSVQFREMISQMVSDRSTITLADSLLHDDDQLKEFLSNQMSQFRPVRTNFCATVLLLFQLRSLFEENAAIQQCPVQFADFLVEAVSPGYIQSSTFNQLVSLVKYLTGEKLIKFCHAVVCLSDRIAGFDNNLCEQANALLQCNVDQMTNQSQQFISTVQLLWKQSIIQIRQNWLYHLSVFDNVQLLQQTFNPQYRKHLHVAMLHPRGYLYPEGDRVGVEDWYAAYKIYLESGKLINLHDWYVSFATMVGNNDSVETCNVNKHLYARFLRLVLEFNYLGFIKKTNRKIDHVQKMIW
ncbi:hypothetical protein MIR68_005103 [Amoeboaphelidium protococcarum]|nr:hypothetical protein MIR68_005103 [Amoeboaphelidium protococcarum]